MKLKIIETLSNRTQLLSLGRAATITPGTVALNPKLKRTLRHSNLAQQDARTPLIQRSEVSAMEVAPAGQSIVPSRTAAE